MARSVLAVDDYLCECGCGQYTTISTKNDNTRGWKKGKPKRFITGHAVLGRNISGGKNYPHKVLSESELGWLAGIIEGEGSFSLRERKGKMGISYTPMIQLTSTDLDTINKLKYLLPAGTTCNLKLREGRKQNYKFALCVREAIYDLLPVIFPLMGSRRQERIREILAHPTFKRRDEK